MVKKKRERQPLGKMLSLRIDEDLWRRLQEYRETLIPRVSSTALLEAALIEYLHNHEPKTKKGQQ